MKQSTHESQGIVKQTKKFITVNLHLVPEYEFISLITSWGADVEVLQPKWLREKIENILGNTLELYKK